MLLHLRLHFLCAWQEHSITDANLLLPVTPDPLLVRYTFTLHARNQGLVAMGTDVFPGTYHMPT